MIFSETNAALELLGRIREWLQPGRQIPDTLADRFLRLFEAHGVHRNQIPRFFGHGITIKDVQSPITLAEVLTEEALQSVCNMFAINRRWLDGVTNDIYPIHRCYKRPEQFANALDRLVEQGNSLNCWVLVGSHGKRPKYETYDAVLIIEEEIGHVENFPVYRFHLWDQWVFNYWKCRAYLSACVAYACKQDIQILGLYGDRGEIARVAEGRAFLPMDNHGGGIAAVGPRWYPEDLATTPAIFLDGLAERDGSTGEKKGLQRWLDLEAEGWLCSGEGRTCREEFQKALEVR